MGCLASMQVFPGRTEEPLKRFQGVGSVSRKSDYRQIRIPLSEREIFSISKSWKAISRNITHTGCMMFLNMFETRSDVKAMFEQFRTVEKVELSESRSLENHAILVMNALDEAMSNLDDPDYLVEMILTTGKSHRRFENFQGDVFWAIEDPFLRAVRETLMDRYTSSMERIYRKIIRFVLTLLVTGHQTDDWGEAVSMLEQTMRF